MSEAQPYQDATQTPANFGQTTLAIGEVETQLLHLKLMSATLAETVSLLHQLERNAMWEALESLDVMHQLAELRVSTTAETPVATLLLILRQIYVQNAEMELSLPMLAKTAISETETHLDAIFSLAKNYQDTLALIMVEALPQIHSQMLAIFAEMVS